MARNAYPQRANLAERLAREAARKVAAGQSACLESAATRRLDGHLLGACASVA